MLGLNEGLDAAVSQTGDLNLLTIRQRVLTKPTVFLVFGLWPETVMLGFLRLTPVPVLCEYAYLQ